MQRARGQRTGSIVQVLPNGTAVIRGDGNKLRQINCPKCHLELNAKRQPNGKAQYKCGRCGWAGTSNPM